MIGKPVDLGETPEEAASEAAKEYYENSMDARETLVKEWIRAENDRKREIAASGRKKLTIKMGAKTAVGTLNALKHETDNKNAAELAAATELAKAIVGVEFRDPEKTEPMTGSSLQE